MGNQNIQLQEPERFISGDTLWYERYLPDYLPSDNWSLSMVLTSLGGNKVAAVDSVVSDTDGSRHKIYAQNFAGGLDPGDYILTEEAVNSVSKDRHQVYQGVLTLGPDLADGLAAGNQQTEAQEMIAIIRTTLLGLYKRMNAHGDMQRNKFVLQDIAKMRGELAYWKEVRNNEIQQERSRNGLPSLRRPSPIFVIGA